MISNWIKSAGIRAIKTFAQTFLATIGTGAVVLGDVNWIMVLSASVLAAVLSLVTSLAGLPEVKTDEPTKIEEIKIDTVVIDEPAKTEETTKTEEVTTEPVTKEG